ncbi:hypothetical protein, partial [Citrobacter portucalensis]|uniref:hypothetical protein n=1 Tax=Citrobacter portucalensis TaxID=1639133 RepID=UPI00292ADC13|nr:hypothetical protein [Citrobacter portucalensis]MEB0662334.1 hypothetical protein [Citrobacter portucalensis]
PHPAWCAELPDALRLSGLRQRVFVGHIPAWCAELPDVLRLSGLRQRVFVGRIRLGALNCLMRYAYQAYDSVSL